MNTPEQVCCLKRSDLQSLFGTPLPQGGFQGPSLPQVLRLGQVFRPRPEAEGDPRLKQLIPYQLFCCQGRYFVYQRGGGVGEGRLAGRLSVGIGGHINSGDASGDHLSPEGYEAALHRERQEELICPTTLTADFIGWINDEANPVGQVHLGAVHLCRTASETEVTIRPHGEDLHPQGWWTIGQIRESAERFEAWSLLALDAVNGGNGGHGSNNSFQRSLPRR